MRTRPLVLPNCIKQKNPYRLEVSSNNRQGQGENKLRRLERNMNSVLSSATTFSESDLQGICTPNRLHDDGDLQLGRCIRDNLDRSQVSLRVVISCWAIHPTKNIFMAIQPAPITVPSHIKNNWDNPKPAYAATSEQWTKFTGLRASPRFVQFIT